jgi:hypothetical protein
LKLLHTALSKAALNLVIAVLNEVREEEHLPK